MDRHAALFLTDDFRSLLDDFHVPLVVFSKDGVHVEFDREERLRLMQRTRARLSALGVGALQWSPLDEGTDRQRPTALIEWRYLRDGTRIETARLRYFFLPGQCGMRIHMIERVRFTLLDAVPVSEELSRQ